MPELKDISHPNGGKFLEQLKQFWLLLVSVVGSAIAITGFIYKIHTSVVKLDGKVNTTAAELRGEVRNYHNTVSAVLNEQEKVEERFAEALEKHDQSDHRIFSSIWSNIRELRKQ